MKNATAVLLIGLCSLTLVNGAWAEDRLVMQNGDIITGKISKLIKDEVYIDPAYADEFAVSVADVATIETDETFEVALEDDRRVDARLARGSSGVQLLLIDGEEEATSLDAIGEAVMPQEYYSRTSRIDWGLVSNSGNTETDNNLLYGETLFKVGDHRHNLDLTLRRDETDGVKTKEQDLFNYRYGWMFDDPWFVGGSFTYERDPIRELEYRYVAGANVGREIFNDGVKFMSFSVGVGYSEEEIADVTESGAVGLWAFTYNHNLFSGELEFHHTDSLTQQAYGANNTIFKSVTGFRTEFFRGISAGVSYRYDYETEPAPGASNDDTTLSIGIGAAF